MNTPPLLVTDSQQLARALESLQGDSGLLGLVPTMGALHDGHLSLVQRSLQQCPMTAVTIFVNPAQFNDSQDLDKYPRDIDRDLQLQKKYVVGHDLLPFAINIAGIQFLVGSWIDEYAVFSILIDPNGSHAGIARLNIDELAIDLRFFQALEIFGSVELIANLADHRYLGSQPGQGDSLVGPLPTSRIDLEILGDDRFAWSW